MGKQNMALFQNAMQMFSPFAGQARPAPTAAPSSASGAGGGEAELQRLQQELEEMQRRLGELARKKPGEPSGS